jgi:hypothetical protein
MDTHPFQKLPTDHRDTDWIITKEENHHMRKNGKNQTHKPGKIFLKKTTRLIALAIISLILLISLIATILAYQTSTITVETKTVAEYSQSSAYTYLVYLKNNTLYEMPLLTPNQGIYFKQIINNITASLTYTYQSDIPGIIHGNYSMYAEIKTNLWTKTYQLINKTSFTDNGKTTTFIEEFPINYSFYDGIVGQINTETGIIAPNPTLIIYTNVLLTQTTSQGVIQAQFTPELSMTLTQKTLEISKNLSTIKNGELTKQTTSYQPSVVLQRNLWAVITLVVAILFCVFFFMTKNRPEHENETENIIKKIYRKNGEWILKTTAPPPTVLQHILRFTSIEDIIKISEDLNKPIFHYTESNQQRHIFYIIDASTTYLYELISDKTNHQSNPPTKKIFFHTIIF